MDLLSCRNSSHLHLAGCLFAIIVAAGCLLAEPSQAERNRERSDPGQDAGVTLALVADATGVKISASLRNQGAKTLFLVIGTITANDKWLCPDRIELLMTRPDGKAYRSDSSLGCNPSGGMAGRMDPFIIPLAAGASYSLPVLNLQRAPAGRYSVKARYTGVPISSRSCNLDMQGLALIHYWTGAVDSNTITADIR